MDQAREQELMRQGRAHACQLISAGALVLDEDGEWEERGEVVDSLDLPESECLSDPERAVWLAGYRDELRQRRALHTAETGPFPRSASLSDDEAEALERHEHALDCDLPDHTRCDAGG
jgi:hypothetical protein